MEAGWSLDPDPTKLAKDTLRFYSLYEGSIFYGDIIIPFVDRFPEDTELYRIMTTKPNEVNQQI